MEKPTLLILSFTEAVRDARILKQVALFKGSFRVVTCTYGPAPLGVVEHIQVPSSEAISYMNGRMITLKLYSLVYWRTPAIVWANRTLRGRRFDVVLADDYEAVPLALSLKPKYGVHADLHEYAPSQFEHVQAWNKRIKPYREWVVRKYVSRADSWTAACQGFADKYNEVFGFLPEVVTNAAPYANLSPTPVEDPIRLVHHGGASDAREIDVMIRAVMESTANVVFDLFLQDRAGHRIAKLRELAEADSRISVKEAVPYEQLIPKLNQYDIGLHRLPPVNFNHEWALPNKIFDFVQARLGVIIGPSPAMSPIVEEFSLGIVTDDFSKESFIRALSVLDVKTVREWKDNSNQAAPLLASEKQDIGWETPISALISRGA